MNITVADKLHWTFKLYDKDGSGEIGKTKLYKFFIRRLLEIKLDIIL